MINSEEFDAWLKKDRRIKKDEDTSEFERNLAKSSEFFNSYTKGINCYGTGPDRLAQIKKKNAQLFNLYDNAKNVVDGKNELENKFYKLAEEIDIDTAATVIKNVRHKRILNEMRRIVKSRSNDENDNDKTLF